MAESDFQRDSLTYAVEALKVHFQDRPDVYVSGNLFIYYEQGNSESVVAPDVFVVFGVPKHQRSSYLLWEEKKAPNFVIEITSEATQARDQGPKRGTYAYLGVREYFQFDPTGDYLDPALQGLRLTGPNYKYLKGQVLPDRVLSIHSDVLGLDLRLIASDLRFFDPARDKYLLSHAEAQAEVERLQAELARLRGA